MADFMTQYLSIMKALAEAADENERVEQSRIKSAVSDLIKLYKDKKRSLYQLALLCIQITWWADPKVFHDIEDYGSRVPIFCQAIREDDPDFDANGPLAEVLEHLEREASEAVEYASKLATITYRRSHAGKWNDSFLFRDVPRPRVVPRSRRKILEERARMEEARENRNTDEDEEESDTDEDGTEEDEEDEEDDEMETDDSEGNENEDGDQHDGSEAGDGMDYSQSARDQHKMALISNRGDVVAEISDFESSVYLQAFMRYWNEDPAAWRKHIDAWEQAHGTPGLSALRCVEGKEDGGETGEMPLRMSARGAQTAS